MQTGGNTGGATPRELESWSRRGASFEGLVIEEIAALARERCVRPGIFFWRTEAGGEVDLIVTDGRHVMPIEIKLGRDVEVVPWNAIVERRADFGLGKRRVSPK